MSRGPNRPLRAARERRHESREEFARAVAEESGLPCDARMIKRWENEGITPRPAFRRAVMAVTGRSADELGWAAERGVSVERLGHVAEDEEPIAVVGFLVPSEVLAPDEVERLTRAVEERRVDQTVIDSFSKLLDNHRSGSGGVHPRVLVRRMPEEVRTLLGLRRDAGEEARRALLGLASEYGQFIGRMAFEAGHTDDAQRWAGRALEWALAAGDTLHAAYVLMRSSSYAADAGDAERVVDLARASRARSWRLTPGLASLARRHEAKGHALAGDVDACRRLLAEASDLFEERDDEAEPVWARGFSLTFLRAQVADYDLQLGQVASAVSTLRDVVTALPPSRHRAYSAAKLAQAHADDHDAEAAVGVALQALPMARRTGAVRAVRELGNLRSRLGPVRHRPAVQELFHALSGGPSPLP